MYTTCAVVLCPRRAPWWWWWWRVWGKRGEEGREGGGREGKEGCGCGCGWWGTLCLICVCPYIPAAPDYGGPCPCGHNLLAVYLCARPLKIHPSTHHHGNELPLALPELSEVWVTRTIWTSGHTAISQRDATVGSRLSSSQPAPVELARPSKQGHQPPGVLNSLDHVDEPASVSQQGCRRPC